MIQHLCILPVLARALKISDFVVFIGVALLTTSLMMALKKRRAKAAEAPTPHEQIQQNRQHRGMRGDLETLMVEIEELSKRFASQLDAKSIQLERLLDEADRRIAQLERLRQEAGSPGDQASALAQEAGDDPLTRSVYELADQGRDASQIARQLDEHVGKVELILALRRT